MKLWSHVFEGSCLGTIRFFRGGGGRGDVRTVPMMAGESENEAEAGPVGRRVSTRVTKPSGKVFGLEWCN
jgi:hypothetical protein